jgi:ketosteroid isomerase-like protein
MTSLRSSRRNRRGSEGGPGLRPFFFHILLFLSALLACGFERQESPDTQASGGGTGDTATEIEEMLLASSASWNSGDLEGFLDDYWVSEELTFSGGSGVIRGWEDVRARYLSTYWAPGAFRDSLRFEGIEVMELGEEHALALGQYVLYRPEEGGAVASTGYFSLILGKQDGRWKILHDHTSASPDPEGPQVEGS